jgi:hypothetical protein
MIDSASFVFSTAPFLLSFEVSPGFLQSRISSASVKDTEIRIGEGAPPSKKIEGSWLMRGEGVAQKQGDKAKKHDEMWWNRRLAANLVSLFRVPEHTHTQQ